MDFGIVIMKVRNKYEESETMQAAWGHADRE